MTKLKIGRLMVFYRPVAVPGPRWETLSLDCGCKCLWLFGKVHIQWLCKP